MHVCARSHRPLAHPYIAGGPLVWAAAVVLCFAGGFGGLITAQVGAYLAVLTRRRACRLITVPLSSHRFLV